MRSLHEFRLPLLPMTLAAALIAVPMLGQAQTSTPPASSPSAAAQPALVPLFTTTGDATVMARPRLSQLIGSTVYNERDEKIGDVEDILLFPTAGTPPLTRVVPPAPVPGPVPTQGTAPPFGAPSSAMPLPAPMPAPGAAAPARAGSLYPLAVLEVGGFLGMGGRRVTVPLADLRWNSANERIVLPGVTKEMLLNRPAFQYSELQAR